ncbi:MULTISPECIES: hypothetical protein [Mycolicibacterium]|uniref:Uncharacterized protein n=1 Tax=Mycolicibacterium alvei TaxID=67081 RepID=A0A6N4V491_9MYCO|nr:MULTISPECIES: hypothetical protein [Mycolicibacterium]MCV6998663.1 hypothetical protein [Mycolicibacterium alvei]OBG12287.1 hypothetical protein A5768_11210 [Mycolicibacterium fortuitum]BBX30677.1 hypothetical protein MALV_58020 [Mycolicibacterium alvei]
MTAGDGPYERFLADGAPSPLAELQDGYYALLDPRSAQLTIVGALPDWNLTAAARWNPKRVNPTPWVAVGIHQDDQLVILNLSTVSHAKLPEATSRALELQAHQFCSSVPRQWARTTRHVARYTHDGQLVVGVRKIPMKQLFSTSPEIFERVREKTFFGLPPKQRQIAQIITTYDGLTMDELVGHLQRITPEKRITKGAVHVELSRMRNSRKICICRDQNGGYSILDNSAKIGAQGAELVS